MAVTPIELFRAGNKSGARFNIIRSGEVSIQSRNGSDWVLGRSGGASSQEIPLGLRGTWYRLPAGTPYDDATLFLWTDYPGHWSWEPMRDMLFATYVEALTSVNAEFIQV